MLGSALVVALSSMTATAQQLPNVGFENWKTACGSTTTTAGVTTPEEYTSFVRPGIEPQEWNGSNVTQSIVSISDFVKPETSNPYSGSNSVLLTNQKPGFSIYSSPAPAFLTFGTPWIYAKVALEQAAINMGDGGVYGGVAFTNTPDAITGMYKRDNSKGAEDAYIIAYLWAGTYKSEVRSDIKKVNNVYVESATVEMTDVDRAIMGKVTPTQSGTLVASCEYKISEAIADWTNITVPFTYKTTTVAPEKMNVVISAADYWTRANIIPYNTLTVDDVKFLYYSRLASLTVGGTAVAGFASDKYDYTIPAVLPETTDGIAYTLLGESPAKQVEVVRDEAANAIKIIVTNTTAGTDAVDADGKKSHTYTLTYAYKTEASYGGNLNVGMGTGYLSANKTSSIKIYGKDSGKCDFVLTGLELLGIELGDITVPDATEAEGELGSKTYSGFVPEMSLLGGGITAEVTLNGTITADGNVNMKVDVVWLNGADRIPIDVTFTTDPLKLDESGYYFVVNSDDYNNPLAEKVATQLTILPTGTEQDDTGNFCWVCDMTVSGVSYTENGTAVNLGDFKVSGIMQQGDRNVAEKTYAGTATNVELNNGEIAETIVVSGSRDSNNQYEVKFAVTVGGKTRDIVFTTEPKSSGVEELAGDAAVVYGTVGGIVVNGFDGEVSVYAADGRMVKKAEVAGNAVVAVDGGLYIVRTGAKATKVIVK